MFVRPQLAAAAAAAAELRLSSAEFSSPFVGDCLLIIGLAVLVGDRIDWPFSIAGFRSACAAFADEPGWLAFGFMLFGFKLKLKFGRLDAACCPNDCSRLPVGV